MSLNGVLIKSISIKQTWRKNIYQLLFDNIYSNKGLYILATDQLDIRAPYRNVITIQHGIAFDIPGNMLSGFWKKSAALQLLNKMLRCIKNVHRFYNTPNTVCVDYNYFNWYRTLGTITESMHLKVIPNFSTSSISFGDIKKKMESSNQKRIIFARRFVDYRGTLLFLSVAKRIIAEYDDIEITFAGDGPLKKQISDVFKDEKRVTITSFESSESVLFHYNFDIAVVPTIFSEGTSLSLCEAMASGCFPIATHVGGMTNMLIDGYNGKLVYPSEGMLYKAIVDVLSLDKKDFCQIVLNAYATVQKSFSKEKWTLEWLSFIDEVMKNERL